MLSPSIVGAEFGFVAAILLANLVLASVLKEWRSGIAALTIGLGALALSTRAGTPGIELGGLIVHPGTPFAGFLLSLFLLSATGLTAAMMRLKHVGPVSRFFLTALAALAVVHIVVSYIPPLAPLVRTYVTPALTVITLLLLAGIAQDAKKQEAGGGGLLAGGWLLVAFPVALSEAGLSITALGLFADQPLVGNILSSTLVLEGYRAAFLLAALLMTTQIALLSWDDYQRRLTHEQTREDRKRRAEEARRLQDAADYEHLQRLRQSQREMEDKLREQVVARNEALQKAKQASEEASQAKSSFIAFLSHEIRTPLNGLMGSARLLSRTPLNADQHEYVSALSYSGEALLTLVNDVLDMSKIEAGKMQLETIDFDVRRLLESIVLVMHARADEKGLKLESDADDDLPLALRGDPNRLRQILLNLVNNAVKFTEEGGVTVSARRLAGTTDSTIRLRFEVVDTGIGIPQEARPKIFSEYGQAEDKTARLYGGTGLGLNICKQLVEAMDGTIGFDSTEGEGTSFYFEIDLAVGDERAVLPDEEGAQAPQHAASALPKAPRRADPNGAASAGSTAAPEVSKAGGSRPLRILIAEDDAVSRMVVEGYLTPQGHEITGVESGEAAIDALRSDDYDVVLMDVHLPDMTGLEATRWIREIDHTERSQTPIIALTGNVGDAERDACRAAGMDGFVGKPVNPDALEAAVEALLGPVADSHHAALVEDTLASGNSAIAEDSAAESPDIAAPGQRFGRQKVLYVEDDPISQEVVSAFMESDGFVVHTVSDGESALRFLEQDTYDAVLMDVRLPGISGVEAAERIRANANPAIARVPIIAISQYDTQDNRQNCIEAGMDDFLAKPVDPAFLRAAILRLKQAREEERQRQATDGAETSDDRPRDGFGNIIEADAIAMEPDVSYTVLVIEDDPISQAVVGQYLSNGGHTALTVDNAEEGLEMLADQQIDVVLMDVDLPGISGLDATEIIRGLDDEEKAQTPVIAITGNISQADIESCRAAGMNDFIGKPVNPGYLSGAIRRVVRMREEATEQAQDLPVDQDALIMLLDSGTLNHLRRAFSAEKLNRLIDNFMERSGGIIEALGSAVEREDRQVLRSQAHLLKGMAANVGMAALCEIAADIEKGAAEGDLAALRALVEQLSPMLDASRMALDYLQPAEERVA